MCLCVLRVQRCQHFYSFAFCVFGVCSCFVLRRVACFTCLLLFCVLLFPVFLHFRDVRLVFGVFCTFAGYVCFGVVVFSACSQTACCAISLFYVSYLFDVFELLRFSCFYIFAVGPVPDFLLFLYFVFSNCCFFECFARLLVMCVLACLCFLRVRKRPVVPFHCCCMFLCFVHFRV